MEKLGRGRAVGDRPGSVVRVLPTQDSNCREVRLANGQGLAGRVWPGPKAVVCVSDLAGVTSHLPASVPTPCPPQCTAQCLAQRGPAKGKTWSPLRPTPALETLVLTRGHGQASWSPMVSSPGQTAASVSHPGRPWSSNSTVSPPDQAHAASLLPQQQSPDFPGPRSSWKPGREPENRDPWAPFPAPQHPRLEGHQSSLPRRIIRTITATIMVMNK